MKQILLLIYFFPLLQYSSLEFSRNLTGEVSLECAFYQCVLNVIPLGCLCFIFINFGRFWIWPHQVKQKLMVSSNRKKHTKPLELQHTGEIAEIIKYWCI